MCYYTCLQNVDKNGLHHRAALARVLLHVLARVLLHVLAHVLVQVLAKCGSKWPCTQLPRSVLEYSLGTRLPYMEKARYLGTFFRHFFGFSAKFRDFIRIF